MGIRRNIIDAVKIFLSNVNEHIENKKKYEMLYIDVLVKDPKDTEGNREKINDFIKSEVSNLNFQRAELRKLFWSYFKSRQQSSWIVLSRRIEKETGIKFSNLTIVTKLY